VNGEAIILVAVLVQSYKHLTFQLTLDMFAVFRCTNLAQSVFGSGLESVELHGRNAMRKERS